MVDYAKINKERNEQLKRCINGKTVCFPWKEGFTNLDLKINIPPLVDNEYSVWGDWGPTYTFEMNPEKLVKIKQTSEKQGQEENYSIENKKIYLESPMIGKVRDEQPLFYVIEDAKKAVTYHIFMDKAGTPNEVKILRNKDKVVLFETTEIN